MTGQVFIPAAPWLPDQAAFNVLTGAENNVANSPFIMNLLPTLRGYKGWPGLDPLMEGGTALPELPIGDYSSRDDVGNVISFVGTASSIWVPDYLNRNFTDVSRPGKYNGTEQTNWRFQRFGNYVFATNNVDVLQYYDIVAGGTFVDVPEAATDGIIAADISIFRDQLVLGNVKTNADGRVVNKVKTSAYNNPFSWAKNISVLADEQTIPGLGKVQRVLGGEYLTIICETGVVRADLVGGQTVYFFDELEGLPGTLEPDTAIKFSTREGRDAVFWWSTDGFRMFDGEAAYPIGDEMVDETFRSGLDGELSYKQSVIYDPMCGVIMWGFPVDGLNIPRSGNNNAVIAYSPTLKKWSIASFPHQRLSRSAISAVDIDSLHTLYPNIDEVPGSLDDNTWQGGGFSPVVYEGGLPYIMRGQPLTATIQLIETQAFEGHRATVTGVLPMIDGTAQVQARIGRRNTLRDQVTWGNYQQTQPNGYIRFRDKGRFQRVELVMSGGTIDHLIGAKVVAARGERR